LLISRTNYKCTYTYTSVTGLKTSEYFGRQRPPPIYKKTLSTYTFYERMIHNIIAAAGELRAQSSKVLVPSQFDYLYCLILKLFTIIQLITLSIMNIA